MTCRSNLLSYNPVNILQGLQIMKLLGMRISLPTATSPFLDPSFQNTPIVKMPECLPEVVRLLRHI